MPDPGIDISTAMKLIHSSNAKRTEAEKDPLAKEILDSLKKIHALQNDMTKAYEDDDEAGIKAIQESIEDIKKEMESKGIDSDIIEWGDPDQFKESITENIVSSIKDDMGEMTDDTIASLVKMMKTGKSDDDGKNLSKDMEESLILTMSATLSKVGMTNNKDIKDVIKYLKTIGNDVSISNRSISEIISMNSGLNNYLADIMKYDEKQSDRLLDKISSLDDKELQMLLVMDDMPKHILEAAKKEEINRDLAKYSFGRAILSFQDSLDVLNKKWKKWGEAISNPIGFIKPMFKTIGNMFSLIFKTIIPTLWSLAVSFFTVVLPIVLLIIGVIFVILFLIYAFYTGFWKAFKQLGSIIWNLLLAYLKFVWEHKVVGTIMSILLGIVAYNTVMKAWTAAKTIYDALFKRIVVKQMIDGQLRTIGVINKGFFWQAKEWVWNKAQWAWNKIQWAWNKTQWARGLLKSFIRFIPMIFTWLAGPGLTMLGSILAAIPVIGWIILAIGVVVAFVWFFRKEIWGFIKMVFGWIWNGLKLAWNFVYDTVMGIWNWAIGIWDTLGTPMKILLGIMISPVLIALAPLIIAIATITAPIAAIYLLVKYWEPIINWIKSTLEKAWSYLTSLPEALLEGLSGVIASIGNPLNWFADGGVVQGPTQAVIGEAGPEAVLPLKGAGGNSLMGVLDNFFNTYMPFLLPLVNFLWDNFKPYMPILQAVLDSIYSVVYSIISGLAQLPGWLGGEFFASMLSGLAAPKSGGGSSGGTPEETKLLLSIVSGDIGETPVLGLVGKNESQITQFDSAKRPMGIDTMMRINSFITGAADSMEVPKYAQDMQKGIEEIGDGIGSLVGKIDRMEKNIMGAVSQGNKTVTQDKQFELSKLMSRNSFNGGKV